MFLICYLGEECPGEILSFTDANPKTIVQKLGGRQGDRVYDQDGLSCTLTSNGGGFAGNTGLYSVGQLPIKSLTKSGFQIAEPGDSIDLAYPNLNTRRGRVGKQIAHTITPNITQGVYFIDMNPEPKITELARCITARQDAGISNRRGEHSGVLEKAEEGPRAVLTPDREIIRQQGRRNLYRCVRDHPDELCEELRYSLNSRTDFEHIREVLKSKTAIPDIKRAAYFYQIIRESYASGLDSFGAQPHNMWRNFPLITEASRRLQSVVIENKDFEKLISQYDRPNTIFYLDPPYYETEDYYEDVGFGRADHERLCNALMKIKGKFLLSYNDCPEIRELYSREGIMIESTTRISNIAQRFDAGKQYPELLSRIRP